MHAISQIWQGSLSGTQTVGTWFGIHKGATGGAEKSLYGSNGATNPVPPPPPPNMDDASTAARQSQDMMRQRRGVLANIYAGNSPGSGVAPVGVKTALGT